MLKLLLFFIVTIVVILLLQDASTKKELTALKAFPQTENEPTPIISLSPVKSLSPVESEPISPKPSKPDLWRVEEYTKSVYDKLSLTEEEKIKVRAEFEREVSGKYLSLEDRLRVIERALGKERSDDYKEAFIAELKAEESKEIDSELGRLLLKRPLSDQEKSLVRGVLLESRVKIEPKLRERAKLMEELMVKHFDEDKTELQKGYMGFKELNQEIKKERLQFVFDNLPKELAEEVAGVLE
jgi:hypothetical protein